MLSVDINVLIRFLTRDDPAQSRRARDLIAGADIWVGATVILETEWVLRSVFGYSPDEFCAAIRALAGLPRLKVDRETAVERALRLHAQGMDFADALHLSMGEPCEAFVTFDRACLDAAQRLGLAVRAP